MRNSEFRATRRNPYAARRIVTPGLSPSINPPSSRASRAAVSVLLSLPCLAAALVLLTVSLSAARWLLSML